LVVVPSRHSQLRLLMLAVTLAVSACGGGGGGGDTTATAASLTPPRPVEQSDLQIASAIYSGNSRTPAGFAIETPPNVQGVVATAHVKNTDVDPDVPASSAQFELCTNDWNQALAWSETSAHSKLQYANLIATNEDPRYFEFARMQLGSPEVYVQSRIYKCAYLNRANANLREGSGAAGQLNVRPLESSELRRTSEYLWQFTTYNNFGNVVLKSAGTSGTTPEHTLFIATLARGGLSATCDRIDVVAWRHRLDASSGALTLDMQTLWTFGARESAGIAELCAA
jgi:hypothetical protein